MISSRFHRVHKYLEPFNLVASCTRSQFCKDSPYLTLRRIRNMSTTARSNPKIPAIPRPSASLIIVNHQNEILLVQRNPNAGSFAGAHVFPGGNYDQKQDASLGITAIRETFEETGLLLASPFSSAAAPSDSELDEARISIWSHQRLFKDFLAQHQLTADTSSLLPFTQWITPPQVPRRFHTQFYVVFLNVTSSADFTSGDKQERLPTPDGGQEVIAARFIHPGTLLEEYKANKLMLFPPQFYLIKTLSEILQTNKTTFDQREKVKQLSTGLFGRMVINPRALPGKQGDKLMALTYEGDETRGGSPGRLHRSLMKPTKGFVVVDIQRNFDIFTEIEGHLFDNSPKLKL